MASEFFHHSRARAIERKVKRVRNSLVLLPTEKTAFVGILKDGVQVVMVLQELQRAGYKHAIYNYKERMVYAWAD
jgi:hypothetical protein